MKTKHIKVDFNAHISDIIYNIEVNNSIPIAEISFHNLSHGTITAIKFRATGYNSFGDKVIIGGKETFIILLQDLNVEINTDFINGRVNLPSPEIRKLEIQESQICFSNGSVLCYESPDYYENDIEVLDSSEKTEQQVLEVLQDYEKSAICLPKDLEGNWLCICGYINKNISERCINCFNSKEEVLSKFADENISSLIEQKQISKQKLRDQEEKAKLQALRKRKKKIIIGICIAVIACVLIGMAIDASIISERTTFNSESEMIAYLNGEWTCSTTYSSQTYSFSDTQVSYEYISKYSDGLNFDYTTRTTYNFKRGYVQLGATQLILKGSTLVDGNDVYRKGAIKYHKTEDTEDTLYESAYSVLEFSNLKLSSNSSYEVCTGTITNNGEKTYSFVEVKGSFKDNSGTVVDTDWTYAVGSEGLAPGESKTFRMSVPKDSSITTVSVSILDNK